MKRNITFALFLLVIIVTALGCSQPAPKKNQIVIWHWMTDRDKAFQELATQYETLTGVKVLFELYAPSDIYSQKIIASAQAKILPDVFGILDKKSVVADFINSGFIADLTADFKANDLQWENSLFPKALAANRFDDNNPYNVAPGIYGVPLDMMNIQMLYNKNLLKKAGIKNVPTTLSEWMQASAAFKRVGVPVFVAGWGELWLVDVFAMNYAFNIMGEEKVMATFRGEIPYTDSQWVEVFKVFADLRHKGVFTNSIVTKTNKDAERDFALERVAFAFNGSWGVNVYDKMNNKLDYAVMLPPTANQSRPMKIWGGAGSSFLVNKQSLNKEEAIAFLKWLTAAEQQVFLARETQNLPVNKIALVNFPKVLNDFADSMEITTHSTNWAFNEDVLVMEAFDKGIQSIIIGEKTPLRVAQDVQKVKVRQLEKQNKK